MLWGCFSGLRIEEKLSAPKYWDSLNENPVQSIQNLRQGRRFNDPKHTSSVACRQHWDHWTQWNISGETWKCLPAPIQPDRAWTGKRSGEEWQIIAKHRCAKLLHHTKKTWGCNGAVVDKVHRSSTWVKVQIRIIKYYSSKSTAFSILLEWKYKSTQFCMYLSKKVLIDRFILQFYIDYFI